MASKNLKEKDLCSSCIAVARKKGKTVPTLRELCPTCKKAYQSKVSRKWYRRKKKEISNDIGWDPDTKTAFSLVIEQLLLQKKQLRKKYTRATGKIDKEITRIKKLQRG